MHILLFILYFWLEIGYKNFFYLILISILSFLILYCLEFIKIDTMVFWNYYYIIEIALLMKE